MKLRPGARLRSQVCTTEVIVLRAPAEEIDLACGGLPMVDKSDPSTAPGGSTTEGPGSQLGKRYVGDGVEVLVTAAGAGALQLGAELMRLKEANALPSSD